MCDPVRRRRRGQRERYRVGYLMDTEDGYVIREEPISMTRRLCLYCPTCRVAVAEWHRSHGSRWLWITRDGGHGLASCEATAELRARADVLECGAMCGCHLDRQ